MSAIVHDLSRGRITADSPCHLDPDLRAEQLSRLPGWRGALGQVGSAQGHLSNQSIGIGDLFLFWGLFRPAQLTSRWEYTGSSEHRIFGWLQVGDIVSTGVDAAVTLERFPWLNSHPHARSGWSASNTIYVASDTLLVGGKSDGRPGWGLFEHGLRLTASGVSKTSEWQVPTWLNPKTGGVGMTFHPPGRWDESGTCVAASRGQEFVATIGDRTDARRWISDLMECA
jgi:hypothetical protein